MPHPDSDRTPDRKEITEHMNKHLLVMAAVWMTPTIALHAQTTPPPLPYQVVNCIKVKPGKGREFRQFWNDVSAKVAQVRADEGRVMTTSLLRSVMPAGEEARCDAMISNFYEGPPPEPSTSALAADLKKAGLSITADEYYAKRDSLTRLIATEVWRPRTRIGQFAKGSYVYINYMKVHNAPEYYKFENDVWKPIAEQMIKDGALAGWIQSSLMLPGGADAKYTAFSGDVFPSYQAAMQGGMPLRATFAKVFPGKNYEETMIQSKLRDLAQRHLYVIEQRITRSSMVSKSQ